MRRFIHKWYLHEKRISYQERITKLQRTIQDLENTNRRLERIIFSLTEPVNLNECSKVKHYTIESAEEHAESLAKRFRESFKVYKCDICPVHPTSGKKFYHVAHRIPEYIRMDTSLDQLKEKFNGSGG